MDAGTGHGVVETIQPAVILLGLGLVAALLAKAVRLSPIVGYIILGVVLSALGYAGDFDNPVVAAMAEAGVMFLLFNLGLHFSLARIRAEAGAIFGFGALQMIVAGGGFAVIGLLIGLPVSAAIILGLALGLSSTAVVIGLLRERDQDDCPVGRAAQAILIFQDIAAIMLLVAAGALGTQGSILPALGIAGLKALAAFAIAVLFARYLTDPLFRLIARARSSEVFTATALFIALAAGWATGIAGLSLTLGAFLGGVAVAESRYRIMVQTEIEAFRGLFLGFFFISVGLSIDPAVLLADWMMVAIGAALLIALKCALNVLAAMANRWSVPGSIQLGFLLGQGSEFALVLLSIPALAGMIGVQLGSILVAAIAISLAVTPLVSNLGRSLAGKLRRGPADEKLHNDDAAIVIVGLGAEGRAVADALFLHGIPYLAIESDMDRFELAQADGYHVHHAMSSDPRSWDAMAMAKRELVVVSPGDQQRARELAPLVEERLPDVIPVFALRGAGMESPPTNARARIVNVEAAGGIELLVDTVFEALGQERRKPDVPTLAA